MRAPVRACPCMFDELFFVVAHNTINTVTYTYTHLRTRARAHTHARTHTHTHTHTRSWYVYFILSPATYFSRWYHGMTTACSVHRSMSPVGGLQADHQFLPVLKTEGVWTINTSLTQYDFSEARQSYCT